MADTINRTARFRVALKREIPLWVRDGLVAEDAARRLTETYALEALGAESSKLLAAVLFTVGALLLGGGIISFVAANWQGIPRAVKAGLLLAAMIGFYAAGTWASQRRNSPRLGQALMFCGCLVFGANVGLFAQIFQITGSWSNGFLAWTLGSVAMAWAAGSWLIGMLALQASLVWFVSFASDHHGATAMLYPFGIALALLPLAWRLRSGALYVPTLLGLIAASGILAATNGGSARFTLLALAISGVMVWALGEWHRVSRVGEQFGNPTAGAGFAVLALTAYVGSFHFWWTDTNLAGSHGSSWVIPIIAAGSIAVPLLVRAWRTAPRRRRPVQAAVVFATLLLCQSVAATFMRQDVVLVTIGINLAALGLAGAALWVGIVDERRNAFWAGALFAVLMVVSRFLEFDSSLLVKSAVFILCGLAVMFAGRTYERYLARERAAS